MNCSFLLTIKSIHCLNLLNKNSIEHKRNAFFVERHHLKLKALRIYAFYPCLSWIKSNWETGRQSNHHAREREREREFKKRSSARVDWIASHPHKDFHTKAISSAAHHLLMAISTIIEGDYFIIIHLHFIFLSVSLYRPPPSLF